MEMDQQKLKAVRTYLEKEFPGSTIEEKYDFDRGAQTFRIRVEKELLLLKVGEEFVEDNGEPEITAHLRRWDVGNLLRENSTLGIFVGNRAPVAFSRFV